MNSRISFTGFLGFLSVVIFSVVLISCGGSSGSSDGADDDGLIGTDTTSVFPVDLAISSPFEGTSDEDADIVRNLSSPHSARTYAEEVDELGAILAGATEEDCAVDLAGIFEDLAGPDCYGPIVSYHDWPTTHENGQLPPYDLGLWNENEGNEACAASQMNHLINSVGGKVDASTSLFASMLCVASVNDLTIPETAGDSLDLTTPMETMFTNTGTDGVTVTAATLERQADNADGDPVFFFTFTGQTTSDQETYHFELVLKHIPLDDNNDTYNGKLSYLFSTEDEDTGDCAVGAGLTQAGAVSYEKISATSLIYSLNSALFCGADAEPFDESNNINPDDKVDASTNPDGWTHDYNYALFSLDPNAGTGDVAYAWQAGHFDGHSRVFNATLSTEERTARVGRAYFGYGADVAIGTLGQILGFICNWTGPGGNLDDGHATQLADNQLVQRQEIMLDETLGVYVSTGINITYAPTNSCASAGGGFTYESESGGMTNDNPDGVAVTPDLVDITEIDFTLPTQPTDVY